MDLQDLYEQRILSGETFLTEEELRYCITMRRIYEFKKNEEPRMVEQIQKKLGDTWT